MRHDDMTSEELIKLVPEDKEATAVLFHRHAPSMIRFARLFFGSRNQDWVGDASQTMWVKILTRARSFKGESFYAWHQAIMRNVCRDILREIKKHAAEELPTSDEEAGPLGRLIPYPDIQRPPDDPELAAENADELDILKKLVNELPAEQREAVLLYREGLGFADMADAMKVSARTAQSRLRYALTKLQNIRLRWASRKGKA